LDLVSNSSSPDVRGGSFSASPLDLVSPATEKGAKTPGSADVLVLTPSSPLDLAEESKLTRLKKRRMALESSSSGDEKDEFRSALKKGVFGNGEQQARWIDTRRTKRAAEKNVVEDSEEPELFDSDEEEDEGFFVCCGFSFVCF
jgi:hypothetical protein